MNWKNTNKRSMNWRKKFIIWRTENEKLTKELQMMEKDYTTLIEIMERARKMVGMQDANQDNGKKSRIIPPFMKRTKVRFIDVI